MKWISRNAAILVVVVTIPIFSGCFEDDDAPTLASARQHVGFVDLSGSPGQAQAGRWCATVSTLVFDRYAVGDAVVIFAIGRNTAEMAPLFDEKTESPTENSGMEADTANYLKAQEIKKKGPTVVCDALAARARSSGTSLLATFGRIDRDPKRETHVLILSDGVEESDIMNFARTPIVADTVGTLVDTAIRDQAWPDHLLQGVNVQFVLDSPGLDDASPRLNNHRNLELFWRTLIERLDGRLIAFDARVFAE